MLRSLFGGSPKVTSDNLGKPDLTKHVWTVAWEQNARVRRVGAPQFDRVFQAGYHPKAGTINSPEEHGCQAAIFADWALFRLHLDLIHLRHLSKLQVRGYLDLLYAESTRHALPLERLLDLVKTQVLHVEGDGLYPWCPVSLSGLDKAPGAEHASLQIECMDQLSIAVELTTLGWVYQELFKEAWSPIALNRLEAPIEAPPSTLCAASGKYINICPCFRRLGPENFVEVDTGDTFPACQACGQPARWARVLRTGDVCSGALICMAMCDCTDSRQVRTLISLRMGETVPHCPQCKGDREWMPL
jgi:hypothetical protein